MYAITTFGVGKSVTARKIRPDWELAEGEAFKVENWVPGMVWDGLTVRLPLEGEQLPDEVPEAVTMRQARLALLQVGLLSQVEEVITQADTATKITWEFTSTVERNSPLISSLAPSLGLSDTDLNNLFILASTL
jgi:hypothetical protein